MFESSWITDLRLRAAAELPAGGAQLDAIRALNATELSHGDRLIALEMWERSEAVVTADKQQLFAALSHGDPDHDRGQVEWVCDELALVTRLSANTCGSRLLVGRALVEQFPDTLALIARGEITYWYGRALADETAALAADKAAQVEKLVLDKAPELHLGEYREAVRRAVVQVDPEGAMERAARGRQERTAWFRPADDDTATGMVGARLPILDAFAAWQRIERFANTPTVGDERTQEQRRADAFLALILGTMPGQAPPVAAKVEVVVSAETLHGGDAPGELTEYGPIPAPLARTLAYAADSRWRRLVADPTTGWLQACGEKTYRPGAWTRIYTDPLEAVPGKEPQYRPSAKLDRYVRARDRRCSFPGCRRKARRSDLDHTIPWARDGDTAPPNLHPLCRHHHRLKTHSRWKLKNNNNGTWTWQTPTGRRYTKTPYDYRDLT